MGAVAEFRIFSKTGSAKKAQGFYNFHSFIFNLFGWYFQNTSERVFRDWAGMDFSNFENFGAQRWSLQKIPEILQKSALRGEIFEIQKVHTNLSS
jgi:hypothetical protein